MEGVCGGFGHGDISVSLLPLSSLHRAVLLKVGLRTVDSILTLGVAELKRKTALSEEECRDIYRTTRSYGASETYPGTWKSALRLLREEEGYLPVPWSSRNAVSATTTPLDEEGKTESSVTCQDTSESCTRKRKRVSGNDSNSTRTPSQATGACSGHPGHLKSVTIGYGAIVTFCQGIDDVLGGGVRLAQVTEVVGSAGVGKTQFALQVAVATRLPAKYGGTGGEVVYLDADGGFSVDRLRVMAEAMERHVHAMASAAEDDDEEVGEEETGEGEGSRHRDAVTVDAILKGVHYIRIPDATQQLLAIAALDKFLSEKPLVRCIIIDSIGANLRFGINVRRRNRVLFSLALSLSALASKYHLAVLWTNQLARKFLPEGHREEGTVASSSGGSAGAEAVPALGESWSHLCSTLVEISVDDTYTPEVGEHYMSRRTLHVHKSPSMPPATVPFVIVNEGLRDPTWQSPPSSLSVE